MYFADWIQTGFKNIIIGFILICIVSVLLDLFFNFFKVKNDDSKLNDYTSTVIVNKKNLTIINKNMVKFNISIINDDLFINNIKVDFNNGDIITMYNDYFLVNDTVYKF